MSGIRQTRKFPEGIDSDIRIMPLPAPSIGVARKTERWNRMFFNCSTRRM